MDIIQKLKHCIVDLIEDRKYTCLYKFFIQKKISSLLKRQVGPYPPWQRV